MSAKKLLNKDEIAEVLKRLDEAYPNAKCALDYKNDFELLVAVVLSAQATDVSVNKATPALFAKYPDAAALAAADASEVQKIIRAIGMSRTKAQNIIALSQKLVRDFASKIPNDFELLQTLPGVGRKSANVVLSVCFGEDRIAVDTHVFRVANRIGLCSEKIPEKTEFALIKRLPKGTLTKAHHMLIHHGRNVCTARKPACDACPIAELCISVK